MPTPYSGSGSSDTNTSNTYYYSLAGRTLGTWDGTSPGSPTTNFLLTDTLGSVVSSFNNLPNGAAVVLGDQVYGPYGNRRVQQGTISTSKGFTGQFTDFVAGLDYYGARYYDPVIGLFLSADVVEGNNVGVDPYTYVRDNPETLIDPSGQYACFVLCIGAFAISTFTLEPRIPNIFITPKILYPTWIIFPKILYPTWIIFPKILYPTWTITPKPAPEPRESVPAPKGGGGVFRNSASDNEGTQDKITTEAARKEEATGRKIACSPEIKR